MQSARGRVRDHHRLRQCGRAGGVSRERLRRLGARDGEALLERIASNEAALLRFVLCVQALPQGVCGDGVIAVEALSTQGEARPPLEVETVDGSSCCSERLENPTSIAVTAGTEIIVNVEMKLGSTTSQSFVVNTSIEPQ